MQDVDVNAKAQVAPILHSRFEHIFDNAERGTEHAVPLRVDPIATQLRFDLNAEPPDAIMAPERALAILQHAAACRDLPQGSRILSTVAPQLLNATVPLAVCAAFRDAVLAMYRQHFVALDLHSTILVHWLLQPSAARRDEPLTVRVDMGCSSLLAARPPPPPLLLGASVAEASVLMGDAFSFLFPLFNTLWGGAGRCQGLAGVPDRAGTGATLERGAAAVAPHACGCDVHG
jgi:hypothetical protein